MNIGASNKSIMLSSILLMATPVFGEDISIQIHDLRPYDQFFGTITPSSIEVENNRLTATVQYSIDNYFATLNNEISNRGNLGSERDRVYFTGQTRGVDASEEGFVVETSIRYEKWLVQDLVFDRVKSKLFTETVPVQLFVEPTFSPDGHNLGFAVRMANIPNFPGALEPRVGAVASRIPVSPVEWSNLTLSNSGSTSAIGNPEVRFLNSGISNAGQGLTIDLSVSFDVDGLDDTGLLSPLDIDDDTQKVFQNGVQELFQQ